MHSTLKVDQIKLKNIIAYDKNPRLHDAKHVSDTNSSIEDNIPELYGRPVVSKLGDIWKLGKHVIFCGDATAKNSYHELLNDKKARMVFSRLSLIFWCLLIGAFYRILPSAICNILMGITVCLTKYNSISTHYKEHVALREFWISKRKAQNLSQRQLADRLNVIYSLISKIEAGDRRLDSVETVEHCKALKVDPNELFNLLKSIR